MSVTRMFSPILERMEKVFEHDDSFTEMGTIDGNIRVDHDPPEVLES